LSRGLVAKVLDACEKYYENVEKRVATISTDIYDGDAAIEWTRADVTSSFRK
jgi:exocyst complex component 1